jgi:hypothetical protein
MRWSVYRFSVAINGSFNLTKYTQHLTLVFSPPLPAGKDASRFGQGSDDANASFSFPMTLLQLDHHKDLPESSTPFHGLCLADPALNQSYASTFMDRTPFRPAKMQVLELLIT